MADPITYAQLSERAYVKDAQPDNLPLLPAGWSILHETPIHPSGFQAGVYTDGNEIVIAFAGTSDPLRSPLDFFTHPDWITNRQMFAGVVADQLKEAVKLYAEALTGKYGDIVSFQSASVRRFPSRGKSACSSNSMCIRKSAM